MSISSYSALHEFLFHLRTPLAGIRGAAALANKTEILDIPVPPEAQVWLKKWLPKVNIWYKEAIELTEQLGQAEGEDHDWKGSIQQLISTLDGIEIAAREAHGIPLADKQEPGDVVRMMVHQIDYINNQYKHIQEVLPDLV